MNSQLEPVEKRTLLVIALSARTFVEAATQAGYRVTAIDAFADLQTRSIADKVFVVDFDKNGFVAEALLTIVNSLNADEYEGFIYGSGFEAQPQVLSEIAKIIPLIGNDPETISAVKTVNFFHSLSTLGIAHPRIFLPSNSADLTNLGEQKYLCKSFGGCGGTHISLLNTHNKPQLDTEYYQQFLTGTSVSLLFVAHRSGIEVIGFNEQWCNPTASMPFRYGGAVSHYTLPENNRQKLNQIAKTISLKFGLKGLNSLDVIVQGNEIYVLEVNPRLSATVDLYTGKSHYLSRHIQVSKLDSFSSEITQATLNANVIKAHAIVYATDDMVIPENYGWPEWATDVPYLVDGAQLYIQAGAPVCTVFASSINNTNDGEVNDSVVNECADLKQLVQSRVRILLESLITKCAI